MHLHAEELKNGTHVGLWKLGNQIFAWICPVSGATAKFELEVTDRVEQTSRNWPRTELDRKLHEKFGEPLCMASQSMGAMPKFGSLLRCESPLAVYLVQDIFKMGAPFVQNLLHDSFLMLTSLILDRATSTLAQQNVDSALCCRAMVL